MFMTETKVKQILAEILGEMPKDLPQLVSDIKEMVGPKEQVPKLKRELEELKLQKVIEERDIKHLVKIKEEKLDIEHQKKELKLKDEYKDKEMVLQREFHNKVLTVLDKNREEMKEVHTQLMKRLPNVNMEMEVTRNQSK